MIQSPDPERFPHLSRLRLSVDDLAALARQGFVCAERRAATDIFKLRFRCGSTGRQRVRYIGTDCRVAAAVTQELALWQKATQQNKSLRRLQREARRLLCATKTSVQELLGEHDYHFYGLEVRRQRRHECPQLSTKVHSSV